MVAYSEVVKAARETVTAILAVANTPRPFQIGTNGGQTAAVRWAPSGTVYISLPSYAHDVELTRSEADRIVGLIAHECAHVIYTAEAHIPSPGEAAGLHSMANWIEDVWIERTLLKTGKLPGLLDLFSTMETQDYWRAVKARAAAGQPEIGATRQDFGAVLALTGRCANGYTIPGMRQAQAALPAFAKPVLTWAAKQLPRVRTTAQATALARDVLTRLADAEAAARAAHVAPEPPPPPPPTQPAPEAGQDDAGQDDAGQDDAGQDATAGADGQGDEAGQDEAGQDDAAAPGPAGQDGDGDGQDEAGQDGDGQEQDSGGDSDAAPSDKPGKGAGGKASNEELDNWTDPANTGMGDDAGEALAAALKERDGVDADQGWQSAIMAGDPADVVRRNIPRVGFVNVLRALLPAPGPLRDQITQLIAAEERWGTERYRASGRLDRRALVRASLDGGNVFTRRTHRPGVDTAVMLLLDGSGSMTNDAVYDQYANPIATRWVVASVLAMHLCEAIEAARGKVSVAQFREAGEAGEGVRLRVAKGFDEAFDADRLGMICDGGTPLSLSMIAAADMLTEQTATRRILLALTDGGCDLGQRGAKLATAMCEARGVEVVAIGCGLDVSGMFPGKAVNVLDLKTLPDQGLAALLDIIRPVDAGD